MMLGKFLLAVIVSLLTVSTSCPLAKSFDRQQPETVVSKASIYDPSVRSVFDSLSSDGPDDLFIDDYYEGVYFSNLRENFGNNRYGSCSYVSIGMLLSFYDSYWDDSFIPEAYDATTAATFTTYPAADFAFPSFHAESPGVGFEPDADVGSLSIEEYEAYALSHEDEYFQCKLISLSQKYFGSEKFETDDGPFGMTFSEALGFMGIIFMTIVVSTLRKS